LRSARRQIVSADGSRRSSRRTSMLTTPISAILPNSPSSCARSINLRAGARTRNVCDFQAIEVGRPQFSSPADLTYYGTLVRVAFPGRSSPGCVLVDPGLCVGVMRATRKRCDEALAVLPTS